MGWIPSGNIDKLQQFKIFINRKSHVYLKVTEDKNEYVKDWQSQQSLFMNEKCTILKPNIFGIRIENSRGRNKRKRIGQFGNIYMNVGKRDIETNEMSVCEM